MAQKFVFINLDKRQKYDNGARASFAEILGEHNNPVEVIKLLALTEAGNPLSPNDETISWAGDRIICTAENSYNWPDSILAADDCKSLESPRFLSQHAVSVQINLELSNREIIKLLNYSGDPVLRNITKRLYVRSEGIDVVSSNGNHMYYRRSILETPGLGHILMCKIGWSSDRRMAMSWVEGSSLSEGEWAGDRFDVRSYEEVREELGSGGWNDVTLQEAERFLRIWNADGQ